MKFKTLVLCAVALSLLSFTACKQSQSSLRASLMAAVRADNTTAVLLLIQDGADPNSLAAPGGWSALHYAVRNGNAEIVEALLKAGADPNYAGSIEGRSSSAIFVQPMLIAEAALDFVQQVPAARTDQLLLQAGLNDPALLRSMRDATAAARYQKVVEELTRVSRQS